MRAGSALGVGVRGADVPLLARPGVSLPPRRGPAAGRAEAAVAKGRRGPGAGGPGAGLFLGCRSTRGVAWEQCRGRRVTQKCFHRCLPWDRCRSTASPSGIQGAADVVARLERSRTGRNVKGSSRLAPSSGQERGLAAPHCRQPSRGSWWSGSGGFGAQLGFPCSSSRCPGSRSPLLQLPLRGDTQPSARPPHCPLAQELQPHGAGGCQGGC